MRRLRYSVAATLDGFIADPNGGYDWIIMDDAIDFAAMFDEFDTFVMGRKTWDCIGADRMSPTCSAARKSSCSQRRCKSPRVRVSGSSDTSPVDTVRELKQQPGKDIWLFGGGSMFRTLADAELVDTVEVAIMPVLLSQGVQLLAPGARITGMKLDKCETLPRAAS